VTKTGEVYDQHGYHRRVSTMKSMDKWLGVWCIYEMYSDIFLGRLLGVWDGVRENSIV